MFSNFSPFGSSKKQAVPTDPLANLTAIAKIVTDDPSVLNQNLREMCLQLGTPFHEKADQLLGNMIAAHSSRMLATLWTVLLQRLRESTELRAQLAIIAHFGNVADRIQTSQRPNAFRAFAKEALGLCGRPEVVGDRSFSKSFLSIIHSIGVHAEPEICEMLIDKCVEGVFSWTRQDARRASATHAARLVARTMSCGTFSSFLQRVQSREDIFGVAMIVDAAVSALLDQIKELPLRSLRSYPSVQIYQDFVESTLTNILNQMHTANGEASAVQAGAVPLLVSCVAKFRAQDPSWALSFYGAEMFRLGVQLLEQAGLRKVLICPLLSLLASLPIERLDDALRLDALKLVERKWRHDEDSLTRAEGFKVLESLSSTLSTEEKVHLVKDLMQLHREHLAGRCNITVRAMLKLFHVLLPVVLEFNPSIAHQAIHTLTRRHLDMSNTVCTVGAIQIHMLALIEETVASLSAESMSYILYVVKNSESAVRERGMRVLVRLCDSPYALDPTQLYQPVMRGLDFLEGTAGGAAAGSTLFPSFEGDRRMAESASGNAMIRNILALCQYFKHLFEATVAPTEKQDSAAIHVSCEFFTIALNSFQERYVVPLRTWSAMETVVSAPNPLHNTVSGILRLLYDQLSSFSLVPLDAIIMMLNTATVCCQHVSATDAFDVFFHKNLFSLVWNMLHRCCSEMDPIAVPKLHQDASLYLSFAQLHKKMEAIISQAGQSAMASKERASDTPFFSLIRACLQLLSALAVAGRRSPVFVAHLRHQYKFLLNCLDILAASHPNSVLHACRTFFVVLFFENGTGPSSELPFEQTSSAAAKLSDAVPPLQRVKYIAESASVVSRSQAFDLVLIADDLFAYLKLIVLVDIMVGDCSGYHAVDDKYVHMRRMIEVARDKNMYSSLYGSNIIVPLIRVLTCLGRSPHGETLRDMLQTTEALDTVAAASPERFSAHQQRSVSTTQLIVETVRKTMETVDTEMVVSGAFDMLAKLLSQLETTSVSAGAPSCSAMSRDSSSCCWMVATVDELFSKQLPVLPLKELTDAMLQSFTDLWMKRPVHVSLILDELRKQRVRIATSSFDASEERGSDRGLLLLTNQVATFVYVLALWVRNAAAPAALPHKTLRDYQDASRLLLHILDWLDQDVLLSRAHKIDSDGGEQQPTSPSSPQRQPEDVSAVALLDAVTEILTSAESFAGRTCGALFDIDSFPRLVTEALKNSQRKNDNGSGNDMDLLLWALAMVPSETRAEMEGPHVNLAIQAVLTVSNSDDTSWLTVSQLTQLLSLCVWQWEVERELSAPLDSFPEVQVQNWSQVTVPLWAALFEIVISHSVSLPDTVWSAPLFWRVCRLHFPHVPTAASSSFPPLDEEDEGDDQETSAAGSTIQFVPRTASALCVALLEAEREGLAECRKLATAVVGLIAEHQSSLRLSPRAVAMALLDAMKPTVQQQQESGSTCSIVAYEMFSSWLIALATETDEDGLRHDDVPGLSSPSDPRVSEAPATTVYALLEQLPSRGAALSAISPPHTSASTLNWSSDDTPIVLLDEALRLVRTEEQCNALIDCLLRREAKHCDVTARVVVSLVNALIRCDVGSLSLSLPQVQVLLEMGIRLLTDATPGTDETLALRYSASFLLVLTAPNAETLWQGVLDKEADHPWLPCRGLVLATLRACLELTEEATVEDVAKYTVSIFLRSSALTVGIQESLLWMVAKVCPMSVWSVVLHEDLCSPTEWACVRFLVKMSQTIGVSQALVQEMHARYTPMLLSFGSNRSELESDEQRMVFWLVTSLLLHTVISEERHTKPKPHMGLTDALGQYNDFPLESMSTEAHARIRRAVDEHLFPVFSRMKAPNSERNWNLHTRGHLLPVGRRQSLSKAAAEKMFTSILHMYAHVISTVFSNVPTLSPEVITDVFFSLSCLACGNASLLKHSPALEGTVATSILTSLFAWYRKYASNVVSTVDSRLHVLNFRMGLFPESSNSLEFTDTYSIISCSTIISSLFMRGNELIPGAVDVSYILEKMLCMDVVSHQAALMAVIVMSGTTTRNEVTRIAPLFIRRLCRDLEICSKGSLSLSFGVLQLLRSAFSIVSAIPDDQVTMKVCEAVWSGIVVRGVGGRRVQHYAHFLLQSIVSMSTVNQTQWTVLRALVAAQQHPASHASSATFGVKQHTPPPSSASSFADDFKKHALDALRNPFSDARDSDHDPHHQFSLPVRQTSISGAADTHSVGGESNNTSFVKESGVLTSVAFEEEDEAQDPDDEATMKAFQQLLRSTNRLMRLSTTSAVILRSRVVEEELDHNRVQYMAILRDTESQPSAVGLVAVSAATQLIREVLDANDALFVTLNRFDFSPSSQYLVSLELRRLAQRIGTERDWQTCIPTDGPQAFVAAVQPLTLFVETVLRRVTTESHLWWILSSTLTALAMASCTAAPCRLPAARSPLDVVLCSVVQVRDNTAALRHIASFIVRLLLHNPTSGDTVFLSKEQCSANEKGVQLLLGTVEQVSSTSSTESLLHSIGPAVVSEVRSWV